MQYKELGAFSGGTTYDRALPYKFILSGSGSLELKQSIHESLLGRKRVFELQTVTFGEFMKYKTNYRYAKNLLDFFEIEKAASKELLEEYLCFGGYPRVVTEPKASEKVEIIKEIYSSYIQKDISMLLRSDNTQRFSTLIALLAVQIGRIINFSNLTNHSSISFQTLKKYIWYAENTFVIKKNLPFFSNPKKEITKSPVVYFNDVGLRNYILGFFGRIKPIDISFVFQNFIFCFLHKMQSKHNFRINFWRSKDKAEVDFIVSFMDKKIPIEVKYSKLKSKKIERSLRSFIYKYRSSHAFVINLSLEDTMFINQTKIDFIPFHKFVFGFKDIISSL